MKNLKTFEAYVNNYEDLLISYLNRQVSIIVEKETGDGKLNLTEQILKESGKDFLVVNCSSDIEPYFKNLERKDVVLLDEYDRTPEEVKRQLDNYILHYVLDNTKQFIIFTSDQDNLPTSILTRCAVI